MRKLFTLVLIGLILSPACAWATSIGGPLTNGQGKVVLGGEFEYIFARKQKFDGSSVSNLSVSNPKIEQVIRPTGRLSYGITDNFDIYTRLGATDYEMWSTPTTVPNIYADDSNLSSKWGFLYGGGVKAMFDFGNNCLVGIDGQYIRHTANASQTTILLAGGTERITGDITTQEWHIAPYFGYRIDVPDMWEFVPYVGVKYSDLLTESKADVTGNTIKTRSKYLFGVFLGVECLVMENINVNFEGRFIDETALSCALKYKF